MPKMCEGCNDKQASYGTTIDRVKRWCASCGKENGAVRLSTRKVCEGCNDKQASYGSTSDRVKRWCSGAENPNPASAGV
jgi:ribosomal protein S27E